mmetsp:Transcript_35279/g.109898  ORF Transcript_35279/g.109898 Transcript_35279/m.109898 type:complete len:417 (+) Transcript_35279:147-1397(+)
MRAHAGCASTAGCPRGGRLRAGAANLRPRSGRRSRIWAAAIRVASAASCAARVAAAAAKLPPGLYYKPWATHGGCAELVRRFDFNSNYSDVLFRRFASCLIKRSDLPDWHSESRPALLAGEHYPVSVTPSPRSPPAFWVTPSWDYVVSNFVRREGTYEPGELNLYRALVKPGGVVCDVGSHVGAYAVPLAAHVGLAGLVHVFEPFRLVYQLLIANVALNGLANVHGHQVALGDASETRLVRGPSLTHASNIGATRVFEQAAPHFTAEHVLQYGGEEMVKVMTLDSLELDHVDFIKVDVEGALAAVLRGAERTLRSHRPVVAAEHEGDTAPPLLLDWGYRCAEVLPVHHLWACVPQERWWRFRWLDHARAVLAGEPPPAEAEPADSPRGVAAAVPLAPESRRAAAPPRLGAEVLAGA